MSMRKSKTSHQTISTSAPKPIRCTGSCQSILLYRPRRTVTAQQTAVLQKGGSQLRHCDQGAGGQRQHDPQPMAPGREPLCTRGGIEASIESEQNRHSSVGRPCCVPVRSSGSEHPDTTRARELSRDGSRWRDVPYGGSGPAQCDANATPEVVASVAALLGGKRNSRMQPPDRSRHCRTTHESLFPHRRGFCIFRAASPS